MGQIDFGMDKLELKNQEEIQLLRYFKYFYEDFPKGKISKQESPDFILSTSKHYSIGIELTKLFLQKKKSESEYFVPLFEEEKQDLIYRVKTLFKENHDFDISAHFDFSDKYYEINMDLSLLALEVYDSIAFRIKRWSSNDRFYTKIKSEKLPDWLHSIDLIHFPEDRISKWVSCKVNVPTAHFYESLKHSIDHKESKLKLYEKNWCDQYWLLVVAECLNCATPFDIIRQIERWKFESGFHKIFLFELFEQKIHLV